MLFAILLSITCSVKSQNNTRPITDNQIRTAYAKVIRGEQCEQKLDSARNVAFGLFKVVTDQNETVQKAFKMISAQNDSIAVANNRYIQTSVKYQEAKDKDRPWYEWLILAAAIALGIVIAK